MYAHVPALPIAWLALLCRLEPQRYGGERYGRTPCWHNDGRRQRRWRHRSRHRLPPQHGLGATRQGEQQRRARYAAKRRPELAQAPASEIRGSAGGSARTYVHAERLAAVERVDEEHG